MGRQSEAVPQCRRREGRGRGERLLSLVGDRGAKYFRANPERPIIIILRDPVERAFSQYQHTRALGAVKGPSASIFEPVCAGRAPVSVQPIPFWNWGSTPSRSPDSKHCFQRIKFASSSMKNTEGVPRTFSATSFVCSASIPRLFRISPEGSGTARFGQGSSAKSPAIRGSLFRKVRPAARNDARRRTTAPGLLPRRYAQAIEHGGFRRSPLAHVSSSVSKRNGGKPDWKPRRERLETQPPPGR